MRTSEHWWRTMVAAGVLNWQLLLAAIIAPTKEDQGPLLALVFHPQPLLPGNKAAVKLGQSQQGLSGREPLRS